MRIKFHYCKLEDLDQKEFIRKVLMEPVKKVFEHLLKVKRNPDGV